MQHNMPCDAFAFSGAVRSCERYGSGHINETYRVLTDGGDYILQKVSRTAFHDPAVLMENVPTDIPLDFAGTVFSGNDTDVDNQCDHPIDLSNAILDPEG